MNKTLALVLFVSCSVSLFAEENKKGLNHLPLAVVGPTGVMESFNGWRYAVGIGVESEPEYHGSNKSATEADPYVEFAYRENHWEIQSNIVNNKLLYQIDTRLVVSTWINLEEGREEKEASDGSLKGLGDIDETLEIGAGIMWRISTPLTLGLFVQTYTGGDPKKGNVGFLTAHYRLLDESDFKLDIGADISFANADHMQTEFGITQAQATTSAYTEYQLSSGLKSYGIGLNGVYQYNKKWLLSFGADYEVYASKVADSPLLIAGSDSEIEASVGVVYRF